MNDLPPGFTLDAPKAASSGGDLPPGFRLDAPKPVGAAMVGPSSPSIGPGPRTSAMPDPGRPWGEVLAEGAGNFLPSVAKAVMDTAGALTVNLPQTAKGIYDVGRGVVSKINRYQPVPGQTAMGPRPPGPDEAAADAVGAHYANKYGTVEGFKNAVATDPAGILMDASTVAPATGIPTIAKAGAAIDPILQAGNLAKFPIVGGKVGPWTVPGAAEFAASHALGGTTGAGTSSVRAAGRAGREGGEAGQAFRENMRGDVPITDIVDRAKAALDEMRQERSAAYKAGMGDVSKDKTVLDFQPIEDALVKANEVGSFKGVPINRSAAETNDKISAIVKEWKALDPAEYHTPEGLDALKRTIGDLRDSTEQGSPARFSADRMYNAVKAEIEQQAPGYAKIMEDYSKASQGLKEVTKTFSLGEKATGDTAARKLQSTTRNNVQTNYGERGRLMDVLAEHDPNLPYAIAGQALNSPAPRGIVARGGAMAGIPTALMTNPLLLGAVPAFMPRVVGEVVHFGGRAVGTVEDVAQALGITPGRLRAMELGGYQAGRNNEITGNALTGQ